MAKSELELKVKVTVAWWLYPYIHLLCMFAVLTQTEPDPEKLERVINRAIKVKVLK